MSNQTMIRSRFFIFAGVVIIILVSGPQADAQEGSWLFSLNPHLTVSAGGATKGGLRDSDGSYSFRNGDFHFGVPIAGRWNLGGPGISGFRLMAEAGVRLTRADLPLIDRSRTLIDGSLGLAGFWILNPKTHLLLAADIGVAEDNETIKTPKARFTGEALGASRISDSFFLYYGLGYAYIFGRGRAFPIAGLLWRPGLGGDWTLSLLLPLHVGLMYRLRPDVHLRLIAGADGNVYHLENRDDFATASATVDLRIRGLKTAVEAWMSVSRSLVLRAEAGILLFRSLSFSDAGTDLFTGRLKPSAFGSITVRLLLGRDSPESGFGFPGLR